MDTNKKRKTSIWWSLLLVGIYLWTQVATSVIFVLIVGIKNITQGMSGDSFQLDLFMEGITGQYLMVVLLVSALLSLALCFLTYRLRKIKALDFIKLKPTSPRLMFLAVPTGLSVEFTAMLIFSLTAYVFKQSAENYESMVGGMMNTPLAFFVVGVVAPIVEDVIFRGFILNELRRDYSVKAAVIIQGILFGVMHLNIAQGFYAAFAGIILGLITVEAGSVLPAVIGHMVMNSSALLLSNVNEEAINTLYLPIIIVSSVFLWIVVRRSAKSIKQTRNDMETEDINPV